MPWGENRFALLKARIKEENAMKEKEREQMKRILEVRMVKDMA